MRKVDYVEKMGGEERRGKKKEDNDKNSSQ